MANADFIANAGAAHTTGLPNASFIDSKIFAAILFAGACLSIGHPVALWVIPDSERRLTVAISNGSRNAGLVRR